MYREFSCVFLQSFFLLHFCESMISSREKSDFVRSCGPYSSLKPTCASLSWGSCGLNQGWQKQQPTLPVSEQKMNGCGTR